MNDVLGRIIEGSLSKGLKAYLEHTEDIEDYPIGSLILVSGRASTFLSIITDVGLHTGEKIALELMRPSIPDKIRATASRIVEETNVSQLIELALIGQTSINNGPRPADTIPSFFSPIRNISSEEIKIFFGSEDQDRKWNIGSPKTPKKTQIEVPIDITQLVNLSFGIFGKSGTGKTFLGNLIAGALTVYSLKNKESMLRLLIFDMHSEYGLELRDNYGQAVGDGVGKIFSPYFKRYTPDHELVRERNLKLLNINYNRLTIEDIRILSTIFGLSEAFQNYLYRYRKLIKRYLGENWIWGLLLDEGDEERLKTTDQGRGVLKIILEKFTSLEDLRNSIANEIRQEIGPPAEIAFRTQSTKLKKLLEYPFTIDERDAIFEIVDHVTSRRGQHVCISLGRYEKETPLYMIIANLIARRLRDTILEKTTKGEEIETKIIIFLEEAHNFLGKELYRQSPFGEVAREMRKKGVILCVIDQRPSELDPDVVGMLWSNFVFGLTHPEDSEVAVSGAPRAELFARMVTELAPREVFIYGQAINFPVVLKIKNYGDAEKLFKELSRRYLKEHEVRLRQLREDELI